MTSGRGINGGRKRSMSAKDKRRVRRSLERTYGNTCWYCRCQFPIETLTIEHLIPRSHGGMNALTNLRLACEPCNRERNWQTDPRVWGHG